MKNNIKKAREQKGMTQKECAKALNITLRAWQTYEQGVSEPKHEILCKMADMFDVSLDYLLNRAISIPESLTQSEIDFENAIIERYKQLPENFRKFFLQGVIEAVECYKQEQKNDISNEADAKVTTRSEAKQKDDNDEYIIRTTTVGGEIDRLEVDKSKKNKKNLKIS